MSFKLWPKVDIIVLNWNGKKNTIECLESLMDVDYRNYDVIVVDNASTDGSQEFLKKNFMDITLIENKKNWGFGGGFNIGINEAVRRNAEYVLCLNNDVVVERNVIKELVKIGNLSNKIGGLCPMEYFYDDPNRINFAGGIIRSFRTKVYGHGELDRGKFNEISETDLLTGPAMMLKLDALFDVGFFDTSYFYGPEDKDIALRLKKKGYKLVFVPTAKVWHKRRGVTRGKIIPLNAYFHVRNYLLFVKKHATGLELFFGFLYFGFLDFPFTLLKLFFQGKKQNMNAAIKGIIWHIDRKILLPDAQMADNLCE
jgi:GT2 family glycosyltransferase